MLVVVAAVVVVVAVPVAVFSHITFVLTVLNQFVFSIQVPFEKSITFGPFFLT